MARYRLVEVIDNEIFDDTQLQGSFYECKKYAQRLGNQFDRSDFYLIDTELNEPVLYISESKVCKITKIERIFAKALCAMEVM